MRGCTDEISTPSLIGIWFDQSLQPPIKLSTGSWTSCQTCKPCWAMESAILRKGATNPFSFEEHFHSLRLYQGTPKIAMLVHKTFTFTDNSGLNYSQVGKAFLSALKHYTTLSNIGCMSALCHAPSSSNQGVIRSHSWSQNPNNCQIECRHSVSEASLFSPSQQAPCLQRELKWEMFLKITFWVNCMCTWSIQM